MSLTKEEALRRATAFARSNGITTSVVDVFFVKGSAVDGTPIPTEDRWAVHFDRDQPPNIVMDPSTVIVLVNAMSGEVSIPPSL